MFFSFYHLCKIEFVWCFVVICFTALKFRMMVCSYLFHCLETSYDSLWSFLSLGCTARPVHESWWTWLKVRCYTALRGSGLNRDFKLYFRGAIPSSKSYLVGVRDGDRERVGYRVKCARSFPWARFRHQDYVWNFRSSTGRWWWTRGQFSDESYHGWLKVNLLYGSCWLCPDASTTNTDF